MIYSIDIRIEASIRDTEVTDHVGDAVENIFPGVKLDHEPGQFVSEAHKLECSSEHFHEQAIFDAARRESTKRRNDGGFPFALKKQAMFKDVINFSVGNPDELGDIEVYVTVRDPPVDEVIDYIVPPTEEGRPVDSSDR